MGMMGSVFPVVSGGVRLPKIPGFNGAEKEVEAWLSQASNIIAVTPGVSLLDRSSVAFAALHLEGYARLVWDNCVRGLRGDKSGGCVNFAQFAVLLRRLVGPMNSDEVGRTKIKHLSQTGSVPSYSRAFQKIVHGLDTPMGPVDSR